MKFKVLKIVNLVTGCPIRTYGIVDQPNDAGLTYEKTSMQYDLSPLLQESTLEVKNTHVPQVLEFYPKITFGDAVVWTKVCDGHDPNRNSYNDVDLGAASDLADC